MDEFEEIKLDFKNRLQERYLIIESSIEKLEFVIAKREAHNIKGSAAMLEMKDLSESARNLEQSLDAMSGHEPTEILNKLYIFKSLVMRYTN